MIMGRHGAVADPLPRRLFRNARLTSLFVLLVIATSSTGANAAGARSGDVAPTPQTPVDYGCLPPVPELDVAARPGNNGEV
jgi:hypothetical protein